MDDRPIDLAAAWAGAMTFDAFLRDSVEHKGLWEGIYRLARIPERAPDSVTDDDRPQVLRWYARDGGVSTLCEVAAVASLAAAAEACG